MTYAVKPYRDVSKGWAALALVALGSLAALGMAAAPAHADLRPAMTWSGDVDDTTLIYFHARDVRTRDVSGKASVQTSAQVFDRLPRGPVRVFLTERDGRGQVRVVQQPTPDNDFTAAVRIHDPQPGRSHYEIALTWSPLSAPYGGYGNGGYGNGDRPARDGGRGGYRIRPENFDPPVGDPWTGRDRR